jgi:hypothetical protein
MQSYTVYLHLETDLQVSGGTSTHHQERIQLLWVAYATHSTLKPVPTLPDMNKLCNVASCWIYILMMHGPINVKSLNNTSKWQIGFNLAFKGLIRSYLVNRYQRTTINKLSSTWEHMKHGVPQGSVLGPLLFLIYINDFPLTINKLASSILFADNTSIIISNANPEEFKDSIISVMKEINEWFQNNLLTLNFNKTNSLQFLSKK